MNNTPDDLRLVMIDPKMVELVRFNGAAAPVGKVETELERILGVLRWCTAEMDRRYRLLEEAPRATWRPTTARWPDGAEAERLPRIVVLIDELADLMMMAPDQTEHTLVRLAQMARATGIHLVVATQRPSTDVVTGLIKANFPARISFAVASGDRFARHPGHAGRRDAARAGATCSSSRRSRRAPVRLQGVFVERRGDRAPGRPTGRARHVSRRPGERRPKRPPWEDMLVAAGGDPDEPDEVLEQAIELVKQTGPRQRLDAPAPPAHRLPARRAADGRAGGAGGCRPVAERRADARGPARRGTTTTKDAEVEGRPA